MATKDSGRLPPRSTVHDAQSATTRLPKLRVVKAYVRACGVDDVDRWADAWRRINPEINLQAEFVEAPPPTRTSLQVDQQEVDSYVTAANHAITAPSNQISAATLVAMPIAEAAAILASIDPDLA